MQYSQSPDTVVHGPTGHRMHQDTAAVTSQVTADDLNQVIWSLMELVKGSGVSPQAFNPDSPQSYQVLRDALRAHFLRAENFSGSNQSRTTNGWQPLPGGLIMQWGRVDGYEYQASGAIGQQATWTASFPIAFPNQCLHVNVSGGELQGSGESIEHSYACYGFTSTGLTIQVMRLFGNSSGAADLFGCRYVAFGF
jgi:hypothetical protein